MVGGGGIFEVRVYKAIGGAAVAAVLKKAEWVELKVGGVRVRGCGAAGLKRAGAEKAGGCTWGRERVGMGQIAVLIVD